MLDSPRGHARSARTWLWALGLAASLVIAAPASAPAAERSGHAAQRVLPRVGMYYGRSADRLVEMRLTVRRARRRGELRGRYVVYGPFHCHGGGDRPASGYFGDPSGRRPLYLTLGPQSSRFAYSGRTTPGYDRLWPGAGFFTVTGAFRRPGNKPEVRFRARGCYANRPFQLTLSQCRTGSQCRFRGPPPPPPPPITINEIIPQPFCQEGRSYILFNSDVDGGAQPLSFHWESGVPGVTSTEGSPVVEYPGPGSYTVRLTVTDSAGGNATRSMVVALTC